MNITFGIGEHWFSFHVHLQALVSQGLVVQVFVLAQEAQALHK
jgi:hypothetical protein